LSGLYAKEKQCESREFPLSTTKPDYQKGAQQIFTRHIGAGLQKCAVIKLRSHESA
jgi:hypothetical protein